MNNFNTQTTESKQIKEEYRSLMWMLIIFSLMGQFLLYKFFFRENFVFATQWYFKLFKLSKKKILEELIILSLGQTFFSYCTIVFTKKTLTKQTQIKLFRAIYFLLCLCHLFVPVLIALLEMFIIVIILGYCFFFNKDSKLFYLFINPKL